MERGRTDETDRADACGPVSACVATMSFLLPGDSTLVNLTRVVREAEVAVVSVFGPDHPEVFDTVEWRHGAP